MKTLVFCDSSGAIRCAMIVEDKIAALQNVPGLTKVETTQTENVSILTSNFYVHNGGVAAKQTMAPTVSTTTIAADGTDSAVISGLPLPSTVTISGALTAGPLPMTGNTLTLTSDHPGDLSVLVSAPPGWLDWTVVIHAN